jgi:flagellar FliL protein
MTKNSIEEDDDDEPLTPTPTGTPALTGAGVSKIDRQKLKKIAIIALPLLVCAIAGVFFFFKVIKSPKAYKDGEAHDGSNTVNAEQAIGNSYLELKEMIVNLAPSGSKPHFLKLSLILQLSSDQDTKLIESKMPIILDNYFLFIKELRAIDFSSTGNTLQFKEELLKRANKVLTPVVIKDVLIKEMIVN